MFNCGFEKDAAGISFCSIEAYHQTVRLSELLPLSLAETNSILSVLQSYPLKHLAVGEVR